MKEPQPEATGSQRLRWLLPAGAALTSELCLVLGAALTSLHLFAKLDAANPALAWSPLVQQWHRYLSYALLILLVAEGLRNLRGRHRTLIGLALIAAIEDAVIGSAHLLTDSVSAVVHAFLGQLIVGCCASAAVVAMRDDTTEQPFATITGGFPLRTIAAWIAPLVALQTLMGALYRHNLWSVLPHMAGAMLVAFLLVGSGVVILQQAPHHAKLASVARWTLFLVLMQVLLGIADFLLRLLDFQTAAVWLPLSVAHVTNGSLVLSVSIVLGIYIREYSRAGKQLQ